MADGEITLQISVSAGAARQLHLAAARYGISTEAYAAQLLEQRLFDYGEFDWSGDDPRTAPVPPSGEDEPMVTLDEAMTEFRDELEKRLAAKS